MSILARNRRYLMLLAPLLLLLAMGVRADAAIVVQCPCIDLSVPGTALNPDTGNIECTIIGPPTREIACRTLAAGDGYAQMAEGTQMYTFGFSDATGLPLDQIVPQHILKSESPAPTLVMREGQEFYLTLVNVGLMIRPDLFDPHTVHNHGFPNAATVYDGEPMASFGVNMNASFTYYYSPVQPGTYMYHCHQEAAEHMQMGMLGSLYVLPAQDGTDPGVNCPSQQYAYNDGDGSTCFDVEYPIQISSFDPNFHIADEIVQPPPFATMTDTFPMLNGRGYPDTINPLPISNTTTGNPSQPISSLIEATVGQKILLRISSLATTSFHSLQVLGIPMKIVGKDARLLRSPAGNDLSYFTNSVDLGGGQSYDAILDTTGIPAGIYFLYTTNLNHLSNDTQERGGMMTEIIISNP